VRVSCLELLWYGAGDGSGHNNDGNVRGAYPTPGRSCSPLLFCYDNGDDRAVCPALFGLSS
jgi:hypothetical protein